MTADHKRTRVWPGYLTEKEQRARELDEHGLQLYQLAELAEEGHERYDVMTGGHTVLARVALQRVVELNRELQRGAEPEDPEAG